MMVRAGVTLAILYLFALVLLVCTCGVGCTISDSPANCTPETAPCDDGSCPVSEMVFHPFTAPVSEEPVVNLPQTARVRNWTDARGSGSCVHASTVMILRWVGHPALADWWQQTYSGGEYDSRLMNRLDQANVPYAATTTGDVAFLDWCHRTRRGAVIFFKPRHSICLVHFDAEKVGLLDNNAPSQIEWWPRDRFIRDWKGYGGFALTPVYSPAPPLMVAR